MATTQLNPTGVPGRRYNFAAKVPPVGEHTGEFTGLSPTATPGRRYNFAPKTEQVAPHEGRFTCLSTTATPGRCYDKNLFAGKTPAVFIPAKPGGSSSKHPGRVSLRQLHREDEEIIMVLTSIINAGILQ